MREFCCLPMTFIFFHQKAVIPVGESVLVGRQSCCGGKEAACSPWHRKMALLSLLSHSTAFHCAIVSNFLLIKQILTVHLTHWSCKYVSFQQWNLLYSKTTEDGWLPACSSEEEMVLTADHDKANCNSPVSHGLNETPKPHVATQPNM